MWSRCCPSNTFSVHPTDYIEMYCSVGDVYGLLVRQNAKGLMHFNFGAEGNLQSPLDFKTTNTLAIEEMQSDRSLEGLMKLKCFGCILKA